MTPDELRKLLTMEEGFTDPVTVAARPRMVAAFFQNVAPLLLTLWERGRMYVDVPDAARYDDFYAALTALEQA